MGNLVNASRRIEIDVSQPSNKTLAQEKERKKEKKFKVTQLSKKQSLHTIIMGKNNNNNNNNNNYYYY